MKTAYLIALIAALGIVCYSYSLGGDFIWDDHNFVVNNSFIRSIRNAPLFFTNPPTLAKGNLAFENYRPLVTLSYAVDYIFWSLNTFGYHLTNLLFHILNAILVFLLLDKLSRKRELSFFTALLFLTHPVQTEAVSWISGRSNVLFVFFYLLALILYAQSNPKDAILRPSLRVYAFYFLSLLSFSLSVLSKEAAATLPFMICSYDMLLRSGKLDKQKLFFWLPYFILLFGYILLRYCMLGKFAQRSYWGDSAFLNYLTIPKLIKLYLSVLVLPLNLCADRNIGLVRSFRDPQFVYGALLITFFVGTFITALKRNKAMAFFILWFFVTLSPYLNFIPINILLAERFLYLPSIGIFFVSSLILHRLVYRKVNLYYLVVAPVVFVLMFLTVQRNLDWQDERSLYKSSVKVEPRNARIRSNLGIAYYESGEYGLAEGQFKEAIEIDKSLSHSYVNLGKLYLEQRRIQEAKDIVKRGIEVAIQDSELLNLLAVIHIQDEKRDEAELILRGIIERDPKYFKAYLNLVRLLEEGASYDGAISLYTGALNKFETDYEKGLIWLRIAGLYEKKNLPDLARNIYEYVITAFPHEETLKSIAVERLAESIEPVTPTRCDLGK